MQAYPPGFIKGLRHRIAQIIEGYSANDVPAVCRRYGIGDGDRDEAMGGKYKYASKRLLELNNDKITEVAKEVAQEEGDAELIELLNSMEKRAPQLTPVPTPADTSPRSARTYYSIRTGKHPSGGRLSLNDLKGIYGSALNHWNEQGYLQEHFGYVCVDDGEVPGKLGRDINARMLMSLGKNGLWPIAMSIENYSEDDLFDVIEFVFDHVSKPLDGRYHSYSDCGMHHTTFDVAAGRAEYSSTVNQMLARYGEGYELSSAGEVLELGPDGTASLLSTPIPAGDDNVKGRVDSAILKFRRYRSTVAERRDAVRDLADVFEYLRPQVQRVLTAKDQGDLFNIANNFSIRHHNEKQKTDYDQAIWLSWMFYFYLATIHVCVRMIEKAKTAEMHAPLGLEQPRG